MDSCGLVGIPEFEDFPVRKYRSQPIHRNSMELFREGVLLYFKEHYHVFVS